MKTLVLSDLQAPWPSAPIEQLCTRVTSGGTPSRAKPSFYIHGDWPWVKTKELSDTWVRDTEEHITDLAVESSSAKVLPERTVLVAMYGATVGRLGILARPMACNQACCALVVDDAQADARYVYYQLLLARPQLVSLATGAAQQNLSGAFFKALEIPLPPLKEQRAIAGVLGALDDKIESNRRRAEVAESLLDILSAAAAGPDPVPLGDLVEVDRTSCTPASCGQTLVDHFSLPAFDAGRLPDRTRGDSIKSNKLVVAEESVLVSRLNPATNRTWFAVPEQGVLAAASTEFMVLRGGERIGLGALWLAVRDEYFRSELARRATGTSGSHQRVRPDDVLSIEVPDVRDIARADEAEAEGLLRLIQQARSESATLAELRDALLPELLSGRLRVPVAEELVEAAT